METTGRKLHPVLWVAAVAVILLSAAGIGAIFGVIPGAGSTSKQAEPVAAAVAEPAAQSAPALQPVPVPPATTEPATAPQPAAPAKRKSTRTPKHEPLAQAPANQAAPQPAAQPAPPPCRNCGLIESIREVEHKGEGSGLGAVGGGVAGAVVGSQIGKGRGNTAATVLGAVGGAVAGHQIEKSVRSTKKYEITVRFEDGTTRVLTQDAAPAWRTGDPVRVENSVIMAR